MCFHYTYIFDFANLTSTFGSCISAFMLLNFVILQLITREVTRTKLIKMTILQKCSAVEPYLRGPEMEGKMSRWLVFGQLINATIKRELYSKTGAEFLFVTLFQGERWKV